ncbi:tRNA (adenosine(37)-N6)-threonylcarbamoyltransferase complex dimerization subunit type 1 TsaB [Mangrovicoccus algicola]|uniref:tRNA (Adenosine(37)-N6)-threonylcarbamoyltransferase complex dimerization subunit type 1 TsaB n=1 Tax=Mangrovicoccus algicola TaxID=2771008 RepID=A0A8J6ZAI4_9RHOB|nr:tRNA (adenosine(37)-N6)-threonylcarbamoyltransferase complex dimerization subunit type 1 TsaB [Mangrovicoccus algicola]MBE3639410.1 tRNA (adenosine(37)-N6)-threonylcarbamoyltransferase complex dimerization subunit type 1 TsaB [Mangrovicoccus algicola]
MATLLAFDTSGAHCAAAVLRDGLVLSARREEMAKGQAERLMPLIAETLEDAGLALDGLDAIAVGTGPGNFTGIRLSVAAARGLSLSLGIPAIGVSVLEAMAEGGPRPALAVLDARRGAVYVQGFGTGLLAEPAMVADPAELPAALPRIGEGPDARAAALPLAEAIARVAAGRLDRAPQRPAPLYIRPADAAPPRDPAPVILE